MKRRVLVASNRGPVSYEFGADGTVTGRRGGGGLISGVMSGLAAVTPEAEVRWVCAALSDADRAAAARLHAGTQQLDGVPVRMLDIPRPTFERAYNRVANSILWFTHHMLFDTPNQPQFGREFRRDWAAYQAYNEAFAEALAGEATGNHEERELVPSAAIRVLVQDYHLALAPRLLRHRLAGEAGDAGIAHFWHTPWAPADYYRILPAEVSRTLLDGLLGADNVGFHCDRWAHAFLDCCESVLGAQVTRDAGEGAAGTLARVSYRGRVTGVAVHPLGVDAAALRARALQADVQAHLHALRRTAAGKKLIVRVDRTELSKNIVRGLAAYRELLATRPEWRGRVLHVAFTYPSRSAVPEYRAYTEQVRRIAQEISEEFGTLEWDPLLLEVRDDYPRSLAACALADVLVVNPVRDGMNLVAQEGPVLSERGCALLLSREAGAAATLGAGALLINPYDVSETAAALHQALAMPDAERRSRSAALAAIAAASPPSRWLGDQLAALGP